MTKKLTILVFSLDAFVHVNPCIDVAQSLLKRGHRVVFAVEKVWKGKLNKYGFEEKIYKDVQKHKDAGEHWREVNKKLRISEKGSALEKLKTMLEFDQIDYIKKINSHKKNIVN